MTDAEYDEFVRARKDGSVLIGVDRAFARDLYLRLPTVEIQRLTGEKPYFEKLVVWFAFLGTFLAMLASIPLLVIAVGWWSLLLIPITLVCWFLNFSLSVRADSSIVFPSILLVAAAVLHFSPLLDRPWLTGYVAVFTFALWCGRLLYCSSTDFLRAFVIRNRQALSAFGNGIRIRHDGG